MHTAHLVVTVVAVLATGFSGVAPLARLPAIVPAMTRAGVPLPWLTFPIGTLKTAGSAGMLLGLLGVPGVGTAAAGGLVLFFACAVHTHLLAGDRSPPVPRKNSPPFRRSGSAELVRLQTAKSYCDLKSRQAAPGPRSPHRR
ncbi:DoxX family protein [Pseudonocardia sp. Cha107L01]|uniref:DoxX family protein n=1 Tax=Pseudonocardia sp. Cha107L01 TaxID=3457576 RepID=UPI00403EC718